MRNATAVVIVFAAVAACAWRSSHVSATFRDARVGQTRIETLDRDRIAVTAYKDGVLRGAQAAYELDHSWANEWIDSRTPVDHPQLPVWQVRLRQMQEHAAARDPDPAPLLRAASEFPFSDARNEYIAQWVGDEPERAAQVLDRYGMAAPTKTMAQQLAAIAVQHPHGDDRLARWIEAMADENHRDAALVVAQSPSTGARTARVTLRRLSEFSSSVRRGLYDAVAPRALGDPHNAALLVDAADELSSSEEAPAMLLVLRSPGADRELGIRVLRAIDDFRSTDRAELYAACAPLVAGAERGADALVAALGSLRRGERFAAVRPLIEQPADADLVAGLLRATGELPTRDRPRLIEAALRQPLWNPTIERAALDAAGEVSGRSNRERIREAVSEHASRANR